MRTETDFLGSVEIPDDALYGIASVRARDNFPLGYKKADRGLIMAMVTVKKAAAHTFLRLTADRAEQKKFAAIEIACDRILSGEIDTQEAFVADALAGGAGTSLHYNVCEVVANAALTVLGEPCGRYGIVHPLDDVNRLQSTNDVYPTALRIAAVQRLRELSAACAALQEALQKRETEWADVRKLGRTELMDAVPVTLGQEAGAWAQAAARDRWRLYKAEERLRQINMGGAAVGRGGQDIREYRALVTEELRRITGIGLAAAEYPMDITQNNDVFVEVSGLLKALAVNLSKIAGDIRLMASGPSGGLGELALKPLQRGSTIMPGKVNPVIPEMVMQAAFRVTANDTAISTAACRGEFELNAFLPLIADALLESLNLLINTVTIFRQKCVETMEARPDVCAAHLDASLAFFHAYVPALGYERVAAVIEECGGDAEKIRQALQAAEP